MITTAENEKVTVRVFGQNETPVGQSVELDFADEKSFVFDKNEQRVLA